MMMRKVWFLATLLTVLMSATISFAATNYPTKPVTLVVPQAAGGATDMAARAYVAVAQKYFGQPVVVRIRSGAGTVTGTQDVVRAAPDGYTLLFGANHLFALKHIGAEIPFDPAVALKPVAMLCDMPWVLLVRKDAPWDTFEDFLAYVKANPGKVKLANGGARTTAHVPGLQLEQLTGAEFLHVPYDGGAPANQSVVQGDTDAIFGAMGWAHSAITDGVLKGLAVTSPQRYELLPEVPSLVEFGIPIESSSLWSALYGPKDLPDEIVEKINEFTREIMKDPTYIQMNQAMGNVPLYEDQHVFKKRIEEEERVLAELAETLK
jgi:Uncharacterized protein conserved in bacteria